MRTIDLNLDSTSLGSFDRLTVGYENLLSSTLSPLVDWLKKFEAVLERFEETTGSGFTSKLKPGNISWGWSTSEQNFT